MTTHLPSILTAAILVIGACSLGNAAETTVAADVPYKVGASLTDYERTRCALDVYAPAGAKDLPCVVWFHGGALTEGDKHSVRAGAQAVAQEGVILAAVNYRLSPRAPYPAYVDDAAAAVAWVHQHAATYGGDPRRVFVAGHSAGGYLAAMVGADPRWLKPYDLAPSDLAGVIPLSGQMATHSTIRAERGLPATTILVDDAAPLGHATKDTPPWLVLYAEHDMTLRGDENRYFAAALIAAGHQHVEVHEMAGYDHGGIGGHLGEKEDAVRAKLVGFIARTPPAGK